MVSSKLAKKGGCVLRKLVASILEDLSTREVFLARSPLYMART